MCGPVTDLTQRMKYVGDFFRNDPLVGKAAERLLERLALIEIQRMMGSNGLAQKLCELAQLDSSGAGIVPEVTLRKSPQLHETGVVCAQKAEIGRRLQFSHSGRFVSGCLSAISPGYATLDETLFRPAPRAKEK
jgi:hypothetical protein